MKVTPTKKKFGKYQPGEAFELPDRTAKVFIKLGTLRAADTQIETAEIPVYATRMMQADVPQVTHSAPYGFKADGTPRLRPGRPAKSE